MISKIPIVLIMSSATNQPFSPRLAACQSASPFQIRDQSTNRKKNPANPAIKPGADQPPRKSMYSIWYVLTVTYRSTIRLFFHGANGKVISSVPVLTHCLRVSSPIDTRARADKICSRSVVSATNG